MLQSFIPVTSVPSHEDTVEELVPVTELVELLVDVFVVVVLVVGNPGAKKAWSLTGDGSQTGSLGWGYTAQNRKRGDLLGK
jgi:hypothetical protein